MTSIRSGNLQVGLIASHSAIIVLRIVLRIPELIARCWVLSAMGILQQSFATGYVADK